MEAFETLKRSAEERHAARNAASRARIEVVISSCSLHAGAGETLQEVRAAAQRLGGVAEVGQVGDNGMCWAEPIVFIARPGEPRVAYGPVPPGAGAGLVEDVLVRGDRRNDLALGVDGDSPLDSISPFSELPYFRVQRRNLLGRCGVIDPEDIDSYLVAGGYAALDRVLSSHTPDDVVKLLVDANLTGRGGANFPAGRKWDFLKGARVTPKYMVCNADEGDPGAFVNRILLESDPHQVIEGMIIGGYTTGAETGYIYIRDEYPVCVERVRRAVQQAREHGLLGPNILGSDFSYNIEVIRGAGAYVCGEETGLIASIQDYRGMPRIKPPFPAQSGVFYKPSNVNNVETLAYVPGIINNGMEWFSSVGTERNKGTKLFSLSGRVNRLCIVEVDVGTPMRTLLEVCGGGIPEGRVLKGVQQGGPLGGIISAEWLDTPLDPANFAAQGTIMGSGGLIFLDDRDCPVDICLWAISFDQDESCGRCTSCRIGSMRMVDILQRMTRGQGRPEDVETMRHLAGIMLNGNCVHGQFTPGPFNSAYRYFQAEFEAHILEQRCPAGFCRGLTHYQTDPARAAGALADDLVAVCPVGAIVKQRDSAAIVDEKCIRCNRCYEKAPEAISISTAATPLPERQGGVLARR